MYGGTQMEWGPVVNVNGLSPRVRGNLSFAEISRRRDGSIPAFTGEPDAAARKGPFSEVYPRVYGGTPEPYTSVERFRGLSPRVRGNRYAFKARHDAGGSIPACTGEPGLCQTHQRKIRVYPRVYGGTLSNADGFRGYRGLSPRVRGNLHHGCCQYRRACSIPACTGEPQSGRPIRSPTRVYPRVYGGTQRIRFLDDHPQGLSPRVLGNLGHVSDPSVVAGSIPACTGEPQPRDPGPNSPWVYPRVYGGTPQRDWINQAVLGLSPRVRGNPFRN